MFAVKVTNGAMEAMYHVPAVSVWDALSQYAAFTNDNAHIPHNSQLLNDDTVIRSHEGIRRLINQE